MAPDPARRLPAWLHREATRAHAFRHRRGAWATARAVDEVTHADPPPPVRLPLVELVRFWAVPILVVALGAGLGLVLVVTGTGAARDLGASTLGGVVAAIVMVPIQVVLARRAAQLEFERDGELVQVAVDRILDEMSTMLDDGA